MASIDDIVESIKLIEDSVKEVNKREFKSNKLLIDATIRRLEIIGEAVKNLPIEFLGKYPEIPWSEIAGFRDVMAHAYFVVDLERAWRGIKEDLPDLEVKIKRVKQDRKKKVSFGKGF